MTGGGGGLKGRGTDRENMGGGGESVKSSFNFNLETRKKFRNRRINKKVYKV